MHEFKVSCELRVAGEWLGPENYWGAQGKEVCLLRLFFDKSNETKIK